MREGPGQGQGVPPCCSSTRVTRQALLTQTLVNGLLPRQPGRQGRRTGRRGRLEGEAHVLERERQRELGRELLVGDTAQFGCLQVDTSGPPPSASTTVSVSRPSRRARATDAATASAANASQVLFTSFSRVPAPAAPTQIVRWPSASNSGATRARASSGPDAKIVSWPVLPDPYFPTPRIQEHHVRALSTGHGHHAVGPRHADGAHLRPDRAGSQSSEHPLVPCDRKDGISVGHHRDHDRGPPRCARRGLGDLSAELSQVPGRLHRTVPDDRRDARAQSTGCHPVAHRSNAEHRNRLVRPCHRSLPCQVTARRRALPASRRPGPHAYPRRLGPMKTRSWRPASSGLREDRVRRGSPGRG